MPYLKLSGLIISALALCYSVTPATAGEKSQKQTTQYKTEVFADDFSAEKLSESWKAYKSESKIKNGVLVGLKPKTADHNAVDTVITKSYGDVEVELDFKFAGSPLFVVAFNEHKFKGSHAGHICRVVITPKQVTLRDGKTGVFQNDIFKQRRSGKKPDEKLKALLKSKQSVIKMKFEQGKWYHLLVRIQGDQMTAFIDGEKVNTLKSAGVAHATKNKLSLVTAKQAMNFDNLKILAP